MFLQIAIAVAIGIFSCVAFFIMIRRNKTKKLKVDYKKLSIATWNIAAINNNPFEYWMTYPGQSYNQLMTDVEEFIDNPGDKDIAVSQIFTPLMFSELMSEMSKVGWSGIDEIEQIWQNDFQHRKIISGFLKDKLLGRKRLISMPDRITNTIQTTSGLLYRPAVINCFEGNLDNITIWWNMWMQFWFDTSVNIKGKNMMVYEMLPKIKRSKYPDVTEEEEKISIPLQTLACAIFDAILVHMMNQVAPKIWQDLKHAIAMKLNNKKLEVTLDILTNSYNGMDIIFLQEVGAIFIDKINKSSLGKQFRAYWPDAMDLKRDQNSFILLNKDKFKSNYVDVTSHVLAQFQDKVPISPGDLFAMTVTDHYGVKYLLSSFHGDTNGLQSIPVLQNLYQTAVNSFPGHLLIFGIDANAHEFQKKGKLSYQEFVDECVKIGIASCWGNSPAKNNCTTYNARTFLQPQLNKAVKMALKAQQADINPKDFILFENSKYKAISTKKDNTGKKEFKEGMVFPTLDFPSDHAIVSAELISIEGKL